MKKLFLLFCFLQITSLAFCKHVIFDFGTLVNNCCSQKMSLFLNPVGKGEFVGHRQNFMCDTSAEGDPIKVLINLCSELSLRLWGDQGDIIRRFYIGELSAGDVSEFILSAEGLISHKIKNGICRIEQDCLDRVKAVFFGIKNKTTIDRTSRRVSQLYFQDCFEQDSKGFCLLDFIKKSRAKNNLYLIGNTSREWLDLYKSKFIKIFQYFEKEHIRFSFQAKFVIEQMDFFVDFFNTYKLDRDDCLLITNNPNSLSRAKVLGIKSINIDAISKPKIIEALVTLGALVI